MKRVLVSGASGFIGRHCLPFLQERNYEIVAVGRGDAPDFLAGRAAWRRVDLLALESAARLVRELQPTHLLNLAWYTEPGRYWRAPENVLWVQAGLNLLLAFVEAGGRRFVGGGSCAEYDWRFGFLSEALTPRNPESPFGRCKNGLYEVSAALSEMRDMSFAWGRVFYLFGPHERAARLVPSVVRSLLSGQPAKCTPGKQIRDFSHVADVAAAFVALLDSDVRGGVNIGRGEAVAVSRVVSEIGRQLGRPELIHLGALPAPSGEPPLLVADVRRLREEVGFTARFDLETGIADTIAYNRAQFDA